MARDGAVIFPNICTKSSIDIGAAQIVCMQRRTRTPNESLLSRRLITFGFKLVRRCVSDCLLKLSLLYDSVTFLMIETYIAIMMNNGAKKVNTIMNTA